MTPLLLDALIRSTALLLAGLGAAFVLRHRSAALQHWILAAAIVAAALAAPLGRIVPDWSIAAVRVPVPTSGIRVSATPARDGTTPASAPARSPAVVSAAAAPARDWSSALAALWAIGAGVGLLSMLVQLRRLSRIAARACPVADPRWQRTVDVVAARYGIRRRVTVLQAESADLLATSGCFRPRIFVPHGAAGWTDERIRVVACHELAHVRRHDWAVQMAADCARRLYWFQPLMWIASARLRRESEHACDDLVLGAGVAPHEYAGHLLQIATTGRSDYSWAPAVPMARRSTLERRIAAMLNSARNRGALSHRSLVLSTFVLAAATLAAAAVHPEQSRSGQLLGTIYDGSGAVLPGVEVTLSTAQEAKSSATTDAAGRFSFPGVPPGKYVLETNLAGFTSLRQDLDLQEPADWDRAITLQVNQVLETVVVRAKREPATQAAPGAPAPKPIRVGGNIKVPHKLTHLDPVYPDSMRVAGRGGTVPLEAVISADGSVVFARVLSANVHPDFAAAATEAVRQWKFSPTLLNGKPVEVVMTVSVAFSLEP
jgi:TonB family protein